MPNETFFNLPLEKQKRILEAAKKEFSQNPLKDASIANIVKEAEISRGSFYQYFTGVDDLYLYYFHSLGKDSHKQFLFSLKQHQGDLFATFEEFFSRWLLEIFQGDNVLFYKNLFISMDYHGMHRFFFFSDRKKEEELQSSSWHNHKKMQKEKKEMLETVDRTKLEVKSEQELHLLFQLLLHIAFSTIADGYHNHFDNGVYDIQKIKEEFYLKMCWLKKGAEKNKEVKE